MEHLSKPNRPTKPLETRNCNNKKENVFSGQIKMKPQSPEKVFINSHEVTRTQNAYLPIQYCPSNLTNNNSNLHQVSINNTAKIIFDQININSIKNTFEQLTYILNNQIDILVISETKLDDTFPTSQFLM